MLLATYKLYRSNAIWYSKRLDGYTVTLRKIRLGGFITFKFSKGESLEWAKHWMTRARKEWNSLSTEQRQKLTTCRQLGAQDVNTLQNGENGTMTFTAQTVGSPVVTDCLCPECAESAIKVNSTEVSRTWENLTFPGKDATPDTIHEGRDDSTDETEHSKGVLL